MRRLQIAIFRNIFATRKKVDYESFKFSTFTRFQKVFLHVLRTKVSKFFDFKVVLEFTSSSMAKKRKALHSLHSEPSIQVH